MLYVPKNIDYKYVRHMIDVTDMKPLQSLHHGGAIRTDENVLGSGSE